MLTQKQIEQFNKFGILKLPQCVGHHIAVELTDRLWEFLESEQGISRDDHETWPLGHRPTGFQKLSREGIFNCMASLSLRAAVDDLLGPGSSQAIKHWGIPLIVFPSSHNSAWSIPFGKHTWHIDEPPRESCCSGIRAFMLIQDVSEKQGPTLAVSGSSNLIRQGLDLKSAKNHSSRAILNKLTKSEPWIRSLLHEPNPVAREKLRSLGRSTTGLPLKICKFCGNAGDVFLMDASSVHSKSNNHAELPRMVVSQAFWKTV
ncbi:MAG: hypothetical protein OXG24_07020 [Gammaproteobacteria bacterium]|nr:hypothetical protein [Gammaproteobacteria bacterium]